AYGSGHYGAGSGRTGTYGMGGNNGYAAPGEDAKTFSGRDLREDFRQAMGGTGGSFGGYSNSGTYGMNTPPPAGSGSPRMTRPPVPTTGGGYRPFAPTTPQAQSGGGIPQQSYQPQPGDMAPGA